MTTTIAKKGSIDQQIAASRRKIIRLVLNHVGQMILIIRKSYQFHGCAGFGHEPQPEEYTLTRDLNLGVIAGAEEMGSHGIEINTFNRCFLSFNEYVDRWQEITANMSIQWEELFDLGKPVYPSDQRGEADKKYAEQIYIESKGISGSKPDLALEVAIGNKEVEKHFRRVQRNGERDFPIHYIKAIESLKLNVAIPPDFLQILKKKQEIVILRLLDEEGINERDKCDQVIKAIYLGMDKPPWEYSYTKEPGMTVAVTSEFIRRQCKKFKVDI